ncbi:LemA family protein [Niabella ginsenosidivorans]|uniref:LemA family protein n=1 Tax=Niabella ginsenosidivorans TaxID=1176587 RepID=A0A1A9I5V7_9BACT|nr:LemA family protein [Niabella ginsenosidivorans]ANH82070.1 LemA family protein [Niabella ginsenosidivorans]
MKKSTLYIVVIAIVLLLYGVVSYNSLVRKQENVQQKWAEVQSTYQRRLDLTPNLVNVVKGLSDFEHNTLVDVINARSSALQQSGGNLTAENYNRQSTLQDSLAVASNRMIISIEKYPVLHGTEAYRGLQTQLEGNERRIKVAREDFNGAVAAYNKSVRSFPTNITAGLLGFKPMEGFKAVPGADKNVEIKF